MLSASLSVVLSLTAGAQALPADASALVEAVDAVARLATPDFSGQDAIGFSPGEPALVGGRIKQGSTLVWDIQFSDDYSTSLYFATEKKGLQLDLKVRTAQGEVVGSGGAAGMTQMASFQPEKNRIYSIHLKVVGGQSNASTQVAGLVTRVGTGIGLKLDQFTKLVRKLTKAGLAIQDMVPDKYIMGRNLYATVLNGNQASGPEYGAFDNFRNTFTGFVVSNQTKQWYYTDLFGATGKSFHKGSWNGECIQVTVPKGTKNIPYARLSHKNRDTKGHALIMSGVMGQ